MPATSAITHTADDTGTDKLPSPLTSKTAVQAIAALSERYCLECLNLPHLRRESLEHDWWSGLRLFLNHSFYQGRSDEVSEKVELAAMPLLNRYFDGTDESRLATTDYDKLAQELRVVIGKGNIGKSRDIEMIISILQFVARLPEKNLS